MSTAEGRPGDAYRLLANTLEAWSLQTLQLYCLQTTYEGEEIAAIESTLARLELLLSVHVARVLYGAHVSRKGRLWLVEPPPELDNGSSEG